MDFALVAQAIVVLAAIVVGVRAGGVGIGFWGGIGTAVLVLGFREQIGQPPIDALLIIIAVILATSTVQAAGGIDWMVLVSARAIARWPQSVTVIAPVVSLLFAIGAGTSNVLFSLLPVIQEVSERAGVRASKPISMSVVATSVALACSPVSAAMAAMIAIMDSVDTPWSVWQIMGVTIPSALVGIIVSALCVGRFGGADPGRGESGRIGRISLDTLNSVRTRVSARARATALIYFTGVILVMVFGMFPALRPVNAEGEEVGTSTMIQLIMLVAAGVVALIGKADLHKVPGTTIFQGGMVAAIAFFGLAWMINTFLLAHTDTVEAGLVAWVEVWAPAMAVGIFVVALLTTSQSTATAMIVPIGLAAGLPLPLAVGLWVGALGGIYLLPTNGLQIAAAQLDTTGSTKLGRRLYDHSFFMPSLLVTVSTTAAGALVGTLVG